MNPGTRANAGIHFPPPFLYAAGFLLGLLGHRLAPMRLWPPEYRHPARLTALVLFLLWLLLFSLAIAGFFRARTSFIPNRPAQALVTTGPYRVTRNPMYLGFVLLYLALTFIVNTTWTLLFLPLVILIVDRFVIAREERYLAGRFGEDYQAYRARVRRWI